MVSSEKVKETVVGSIVKAMTAEGHLVLENANGVQIRVVPTCMPVKMIMGNQTTLLQPESGFLFNLSDGQTWEGLQ